MEPDLNGTNEAHNLDDVDNRLYRRDLVGRKSPHIDSLHPKRFAIKKDWVDAGPAKAKVSRIAQHPSFFKKFFLYSLGFALLAIIIAVITFFVGGNVVSSNNIDINVLGNSFAAGGEQLPLQVEIVNKNATDLQLADLFIQYDKGGDASSGASLVNDLNSIGTIAAGKSVTKSFLVTLYGQEGTTKDVTFNLQYRLPGSNAVFQKTTTFTVTINSSPVALSVDAPQSVTPNQELTFTVKTVSNSKDTLSGMLLHVDYPPGFKFEKSVPDATSLDDTWDLGDLAPGAERDVVVTGTVYGQDGEDQAFHVYTGTASASDATKIGITYNSLLQVVSLVKPFLSADIQINGSDDATVPVDPSSIENVTVNYANNQTTQVTNAQIKLALSGNALDTSSISVPNGFYDSTDNTITWDSTTDNDLAAIEPGDQGTLTFTFKVLPLISGGQTLSQPSVNLSVSIQGKQPDRGGAVISVSDFGDKTAVVSSDLGFAADAFYSTGPFANTGPLPPQADEPTTYTITWSLTNSSNPLTSALAVATLPTYVDWVGTISPAGAPITYDNTTRTIRWSIGSVPADTGLSAASESVSFQVRLNTSSTQVGTTPQLVLPTTVTAQDTFTGENLTISRPAVDTFLQNDPAFQPGDQQVVQ